MPLIGTGNAGGGTPANNSITMAMIADMLPGHFIGRLPNDEDPDTPGDPQILNITQIRQAIGVDLVDNTPDTDKPITTEVQDRLKKREIVTNSDETMLVNRAAHSGKRVVRNYGVNPHTTIVQTDANETFQTGDLVMLSKGTSVGAMRIQGEPGVSFVGPSYVAKTMTVGADTIHYIDVPADAWVELQKVATSNTWRIYDTFGFADPNVIRCGTGVPTGANLVGAYVQIDPPNENIFWMNGVIQSNSYTVDTLPTPVAGLVNRVVRVYDTTWGIDQRFRCRLVAGGYYWIPEDQELRIIDLTPSAYVTLAAGDTFTQTSSKAYSKKFMVPKCKLDLRVMMQYTNASNGGTKYAWTRLVQGDATLVNITKNGPSSAGGLSAYTIRDIFLTALSGNSGSPNIVTINGGVNLLTIGTASNPTTAFRDFAADDLVLQFGASANNSSAASTDQARTYLTELTINYRGCV